MLSLPFRKLLGGEYRKKGKICGIEFMEGRCHGKGGNMEKQRRNDSSQGTWYEISQAVYV